MRMEDEMRQLQQDLVAAANDDGAAAAAAADPYEEDLDVQRDEQHMADEQVDDGADRNVDDASASAGIGLDMGGGSQPRQQHPAVGQTQNRHHPAAAAAADDDDAVLQQRRHTQQPAAADQKTADKVCGLYRPYASADAVGRIEQGLRNWAGVPKKTDPALIVVPPLLEQPQQLLLNLLEEGYGKSTVIKNKLNPIINALSHDAVRKYLDSDADIQQALELLEIAKERVRATKDVGVLAEVAAEWKPTRDTPAAPVTPAAAAAMNATQLPPLDHAAAGATAGDVGHHADSKHHDQLPGHIQAGQQTPSRRNSSDRSYHRSSDEDDSSDSDSESSSHRVQRAAPRFQHADNSAAAAANSTAKKTYPRRAAAEDAQARLHQQTVDVDLSGMETSDESESEPDDEDDFQPSLVDNSAVAAASTPAAAAAAAADQAPFGARAELQRRHEQRQLQVGKQLENIGHKRRHNDDHQRPAAGLPSTRPTKAARSPPALNFTWRDLEATRQLTQAMTAVAAAATAAATPAVPTLPQAAGDPRRQGQPRLDAARQPPQATDEPRADEPIADAATANPEPAEAAAATPPPNVQHGDYLRSFYIVTEAAVTAGAAAAEAEGVAADIVALLRHAAQVLRARIK